MKVVGNLLHMLFQAAWGMLFIILVLLSSCKRGPDYPDTSGIDVKVKLSRIDQEMSCRDSLECLEKIEGLEESHPTFTPVYLQRMIPIPPVRDSIQNIAQSAAFFSDSLVQTLSQDVLEVFPDNSFIRSSLRSILQNWKYYFPEKLIPEFYTYYTLFNFGVVILDDDAIGIGLDFFLGSDYPSYPASRFPKYIQKTMDKNYLPSRVAKGMIQNILSLPDSDRLLDYMIYEGKMLYLSQRLIPDAPDSLIFHYSQEKIDWMKDNELETWAALLKEEMLYSREEVEYRKLVSPSPSGPSFMPRASPGEAGSWIGWQIIKAYMARHPEKSMMDLVQMTDSQEILDQSRYKPRN
ncbi:MAG TPA: hypothetical protein VJ917_09660 [Saprospiraceae bacterium]|nr:hypothetical protein [Saprospiraceae bacterium]